MPSGAQGFEGLRYCRDRGIGKWTRTRVHSAKSMETWALPVIEVDGAIDENVMKTKTFADATDKNINAPISSNTPQLRVPHRYI